MMQVILDVENTLLETNVSKIENWNDDFLKGYLQKYKDETKNFERKKELIRSTLHGVDIKAWAVEIAKLRLWLSMIVDIKSDVFKRDAAKSSPLLPSFAFKIVQGDSLVNRIGHGLIPLDLRRTGEISNKAKDKIRQIAKLKRDFYDNTIKDEQQVWHEEFQMFQEILLNKVRSLKGERTKINELLHKEDGDGLFGKKQKTLSDTQRKKMTKQATELSSEIETIESQLNQLSNKKRSPFAWAISFSDILLEKGWFDILVGNPPYVRQEEIEDPTGQIKDKKIYKTLCQKDMIAQDRWESIKRIARWTLQVGGRSDLYLYFYFRGLALINDRWMFTFITSNSRLDVDFGSSLQEFLIRYCPRWKVIDNQVQRSFASASINTVMVFIDKPIISAEMMKGTAQFINFTAKYEDALWSEVLSEVDPEVPTHETLEKKPIRTGEVSFSKRSGKLLRVIDISAEDLWKDGSDRHCEDDERSEADVAISWLLDRKYIGNKWGGKYLRAPDVFFKIISNEHITELSKFFKIRPWCYSWINDFFYITQDIIDKYWISSEYLTPLIRNSNIISTLNIKSTNNHYVLSIPSIPKSKLSNWLQDYISWWSKQVTRQRQKTNAWIPWTKVSSVKTRSYRYSIPSQNTNKTQLFMQYVSNDRFYCPYSTIPLWSDRCFHRLFPNNWVKTKLFAGTLNSSLQMFFVMLFGRSWLWQWALKFETSDAKKIFCFNPNQLDDIMEMKLINALDKLWMREPFSIFKEIGFDKTKDIRSQTPNPLPDRKELDNIIFDEIWLTPEERNEVYWSLAELVKARLDKAKSV